MNTNGNDIYRGRHHQDDLICQVNWRVSDMLVALSKAGLPLDDDHLDALVNPPFTQALKELSVQHGWEVISQFIDETFPATEGGDT